MESREQYGKYVRFIKACNERIANVNDYGIVRELVRNVDNLQDVSIEELAEGASISVPSVSRLVRRLGFSSMRQFKSIIEAGRKVSSMLQAMRWQQRFGSLAHSDSESVTRAIADEAHAHIEATMSFLDQNELARLIEALRTSRSVYILGDSLEANMFYPLQLMLVDDGTPAFSFLGDDPRDAHAMRLSADDTVLFASASADWLQAWQRDFLRAAKDSGSTVIALLQDDLPDLDADITIRYGVPGSDESAYYSLYLLSDVIASLYLQDPVRLRPARLHFV